MNEVKINEINGKQLYHSFISGAHKIFENQSYINKINVFPVADADTGTNLASTMRSIIDISVPSENLKVSADSIADAALTGARGNSGIIFAQFLYGFSNELKAKETITVEDFAESMKNAVKYAYEAIANPVEGTIISVIKDWAEHLYILKDKMDDFIRLLFAAFETASQSLKETAKQMEKLRNKHVVDAGAKGFVVFLEGMLEFFKTGKTLSADILENDQVIEEEIISHENLTFRYCTEALISGDNLDKEKIRSTIEGYGDSMVVAGSNKKMRIHIHTDTPWTLFVELGKLGNIAAQKVDDMVMQNEVVSNARFKTALLTDSSCDLPEELIEKYQIQIVPLNIHFGKSFYLDTVTMQPEQFYKMIDTAPHYPSTSQPSYKDFYNKYNYLSTHYESIIAIHISNKLSGTWQNSLNAANKVIKHHHKKIDVVNSNKLSGGLGLMLLRAARALEKGMSHDEIVAQLPKWSEHTRMLVSSKTLKYLIKSGRVSNTRGFIGTLLNLKPVIEVNNRGETETYGKPFSEKKSMKMIMDRLKKDLSGKKIWGYAITHANNPETAQWYAGQIEELTGKKPEYIKAASPALVANVGIGVVAVSVMLD
ncbi:MAG: DegV family EDD domain-containing protein [Chlorobi bacterium]|nr:DegV family EDD domain-containing protein [Chlorobiota bacterium]